MANAQLPPELVSVMAKLEVPSHDFFFPRDFRVCIGIWAGVPRFVLIFMFFLGLLSTGES
jgi:hypothetical protein